MDVSDSSPDRSLCSDGPSPLGQRHWGPRGSIKFPEPSEGVILVKGVSAWRPWLHAKTGRAVSHDVPMVSLRLAGCRAGCCGVHGVRHSPAGHQGLGEEGRAAGHRLDELRHLSTSCQALRWTCCRHLQTRQTVPALRDSGFS